MDFRDLSREIRRLVEESPDYVYEAGPDGVCFYNPTTVGERKYDACLFGKALFRLGKPVSSLNEGNGISAVLEEMAVETTQDERSWSSHLQTKQDDGVPWGEALLAADNLYGWR